MANYLVTLTRQQGLRNIKFRMKPGKDTVELNEQLQAVEQPGSGLLRTILMKDQKDPGRVYSMSLSPSLHARAAGRPNPGRCR